MSGVSAIPQDALDTAFSMSQEFIDELGKFDVVAELNIIGLCVACRTGVRVRVNRQTDFGSDYVEEFVSYCDLYPPEARTHVAFSLARDLLTVLLMPRD